MNYTLAVFNTRSQTLAFYNRMRNNRINCSLINNPYNTNSTCGICVKFYSKDLNKARAIINNNTIGFVGFYNYIS